MTSCLKALTIFVAFLILFVMTLCLSGCEYTTFKGDSWKKKYDISNPDLEGAGDSQNAANRSGWYFTMIEDFDGSSLNNEWYPVENVLRNEEYWCDKMVTLADSQV